jgi:hypothetical protein
VNHDEYLIGIRDFKRNIGGKRDFIPSWEVGLIKIPCSLNHNTLNSVRKKVGSGKLG